MTSSPTRDDDFPGAPAEAGGERGRKLAAAMKGPAQEEYAPSEMQLETTRLMTAVKAGDVHAFADLELRVRGRAFQVARSLVGSRDDAMELCQEALMKAFRARASYDPAQPFLPWFHQILRNTCFSFLRRSGRARERSLTVTGEDGEALQREVADEGPDPSAGIERDERARAFWRAFRQLSERDREILALRHFKELAYKEIAEVLAIPEGTVMSRLFHARRRLREALGPRVAEWIDDEALRGAQ